MRLKVLLTMVAVGLGTGALVAETANATPVVFAAKKKGNKANKGKKSGPPIVKKTIRLTPKGLKFGMSVREISKFYEGVLDREFVPLYKKVQPGPRMAELDSELADKKQLILRNKLEFGALPSGLDNTHLGGEFTYNNNESMTKITLRSGVKRYFFFFNDRLWKVIDEHKLKKKSKLGRDFDSVVEKLEKRFKKAPRALEADHAKKRAFDQADWADRDTVLRIYDRDGNNISIVYVDKSIEENLDKHRANKGDDEKDLDPAVKSVTSKPKPEDPSKKGKKKKSKR